MTLELPGATAGEAQKPKHVHSDQSLIVRVRTDYLKYERELEHAELQDRLREERIRRTSMRVRLAVLVLVVAVLALVGLFAAFLIREAVTAKGVVVQPFHAPPDLVARGIDGQVLAHGLQDECMRLYLANQRLPITRGLSGPWEHGVRLELPPPGLSLEELAGMLRARYGRELRVTGDLVEGAGGELALTVRGDGISPRTFSGPAGSLGPLTRSAAEYVYGQSAPGGWALRLTSEGRFAEAIEFVQAMLPSSSAADKPYLLMARAIALEPTGGSPQEARVVYRAALKLKPDLWDAWISLQTTSMDLGDEQGAWTAAEEMRIAAGGRPGKAPPGAYQTWDLLTWNLSTLLAEQSADPAAATGGAMLLNSAGVTAADIRARLHDLDGAQQSMDAAAGSVNSAAGGAMANRLRARLAVESGDLALAATQVAAFDAANTSSAVTADVGSLNCWLAPAEEAAGHHDRADAILLSSGTFVDCYRFRADILDGRGDWPAAKKAYGAAVALARNLPAAYYSWGLALLRHGDLAAAEEKLGSAHERGPHWADPLKAWGDLLMKQGKAREALAKYDEALKYAPHWVTLGEARTAAAQQAP
jgi:tetratricopeptide (TPR) repeat protein